ncbi:hypothetical protein P1P75_28385 [Streptomyces sp. ID05-39B]|uniref:hypothetical protein n=1 Tax=Streptomyces sp. ID05-39B TaxID=3028664 RepID=UPI0029B64935|nr:hypothetical protein [Streptomyces sp. ID05-39B]MDX3530227.1 hypothetical protein [Streptomyces sp. ID05-39B]
MSLQQVLCTARRFDGGVVSPSPSTSTSTSTSPPARAENPAAPGLAAAHATDGILTWRW